MSSTNASDRYQRSLNRLGKWRVLFAGWQLGTRPKGDPECDAVRDLQEARLIMRAEITGITALLMDKGLITPEEFHARVADAADDLNKVLEKKFPGVTAHHDGLNIDRRALPWMKGWKP